MYSAVFRRASSVHPEYDVQTAPIISFNMMEYFSSLLSNPVRLTFFCVNCVAWYLFYRAYFNLRASVAEDIARHKSQLK